MKQVNMSRRISLIEKIGNSLKENYSHKEILNILISFILLRWVDTTNQKNKNQILQSVLYEERNLKSQLKNYVNSFSTDVVDIFNRLNINNIIDELDHSSMLNIILNDFNEIDFNITNEEVSYIFREVVKEFSKQFAESIGVNNTPDDVIELCIKLLIKEEDINNDLKLYDPISNTGGMLKYAYELINNYSGTNASLHGQETSDLAYNILLTDMYLLGRDIKQFKNSDSIINDEFNEIKFDYLVCNLTDNIDYKSDKDMLLNEHNELEFNGRFGLGVPSINSQYIYIQHMLSKLNETGKMAVIVDRDVMDSDDAFSVEGKIRRFIIEQDLLETIVALPSKLFYNTENSKFIWILSKDKAPSRKDSVQVINLRDMYNTLRENIGSRSKYLNMQQINRVLDISYNYIENNISKIFSNSEYGYNHVKLNILRQLNDKISIDVVNELKEKKSFVNSSDELKAYIIDKLESYNISDYNTIDEFKDSIKQYLNAEMKIPNSLINDFMKVAFLTENEYVALNEDIKEYISKNVAPFIGTYFIEENIEVGYKIPFNKYFYKNTKPKDFKSIWKEIKGIEKTIEDLMMEVV